MAVRGSKWARAARRAFLHGALIVGSIVFSLPFLWLVSTGAKQEPEIFIYPPEIVPQIPGPVSSSPWFDPQAYRPPKRPADLSLGAWLSKKSEILEALEAQTAAAIVRQWPEASQSKAVVAEVAEGVWEKTSLGLPSERWQAEPTQIAQALARALSDTAREEILDTVRRRLVLGEVRLDSWSLERIPVSTESDGTNQWEIFRGEGALATLESVIDSGKAGALVRYQMGSGSQVAFRGRFPLPFPPQDFKRIVFSFRGDASWNVLSCVVELDGRRYCTRRPYYLARGTWQQVLWQFPSWEDTARAQRPWRLLHPDRSQGEAFKEPGKVLIEVRLSRQSDVGRIVGKLIENYRETLNYMPFWRYVRTSTILVTLNILGELLGASLVAFAFARLRWPGRGFCFVLVLSTLMVPMQVMMIPRFLIYRWLGWYNTWAPLWVPSFFGSAFFIFLLVQFMRTIPTDLEDSAKIDGAGFFRIYWNLILPLIKPALAAISIFTFMGVWNDFMRPLIYLADQRLYPLSLGLYALQAFLVGAGAARQGIMMAASVMMTIPVIALFFAAQRHFIQGVTLTGMKG